MASSSAKKERAPRPEKRHLVRWTDEMDKKLLLTIQSECNAQGTTLPWDKIGEGVGEKISGGAVIQHLAKLRARMVAQGLSVPPPLKRGGGSRINTGPSTPKAKTTPTKINKARGSSSKKKDTSLPIKSEDESEDDLELDSDGDYGKPRSKRTKTSGKKRTRVKHEEDEDSEEVFPTPTKRVKNPVGNQVKGKSPKQIRRGNADSPSPSKITHARDIVEEEHESDTETISEIDKAENQNNEGNMVAAGASFLSLEDDPPTQAQVDQKTNKKPKLVVRLAVDRNTLAQMQQEDEYEDTSYNQDSDEEHDAQPPASDFQHGVRNPAFPIVPSNDNSLDRANFGYPDSRLGRIDNHDFTFSMPSYINSDIGSARFPHENHQALWDPEYTPDQDAFTGPSNMMGQYGMAYPANNWGNHFGRLNSLDAGYLSNYSPRMQVPSGTPSNRLRVSVPQNMAYSDFPSNEAVYSTDSNNGRTTVHQTPASNTLDYTNDDIDEYADAVVENLDSETFDYDFGAPPTFQ